MLSVYETAVNIRWFVVKPRSHFENKKVLKGLSFDEFKKSVETILRSFQNVKMVAETSEASKDQQSESATGENKMCTCSKKWCH